MKPSKELVDAWHKTACSQADKQNMSVYYDEVVQIVAELAAQWGAAQSQDGKRWRMLAEMESKMVAPETLRYYIINPDKLDYVEQLTTQAKAAMAKEQQL